MQSESSANGPKGRTIWDLVDGERLENPSPAETTYFQGARATTFARFARSEAHVRNHSNILMSVRRVTQVNAGKNTPGVDKVLVKTPAARGSWWTFWPPSTLASQPGAQGVHAKENGQQQTSPARHPDDP